MKNDFSKINNNFIKKNEWIIYYALSKYPWLFSDDDLIQEARIWLCEAKLRFNKAKSSWQTYASNYIKWAYGNYLKTFQTKGRSQERMGFTSVGLDAIQERDLYILCEENNDNNCKDDEILYDSILEQIPEGRTKDIVILYTLGWGASEIAKRFDITKQRVWQIYKLEFNRLKGIVNGDNKSI